MVSASPTLDLASLRVAYAAGTATPEAIVQAIYPGLQASSSAFIHLEPLEALLSRCAELAAQGADQQGPLWGVPFAVKDNIDVAGVPSTAACPAFSYTPKKSAPCVEALLAAGGVMVGKTNMDQFAAGLVGTRTPYGPSPCSPFDCRFISGGSSSGSGAAVGAGLVSFALGTDTAGSGRVPAGLCGCVGIKPTPGSVSTVGVVPACAALDCATVFAQNMADGAEVMRIMRSAGAGADDAWRRLPENVTPPPEQGFKFAVPPQGMLDWDGPGGDALSSECQREFDAAVQRLKEAGGEQVDLDFEPFVTIAAMLYGTSFVAERYSGIRDFLEAGKEAAAIKARNGSQSEVQAAARTDARVLPVTRHIIAGTAGFSATDVFDDNAKLAALRAKCVVQLAKVDAMLVPTALTHWTVKEVEAEEGADPPAWTQNAKLGRFTNFVNLLGMCGAAFPSGVVAYDAAALPEDAPQAARARTAHLASTGPTAVKLPFGVTLLSKGWQDEWVWKVAAKMEAAAGLKCGPAGHGVQPFTGK